MPDYEQYMNPYELIFIDNPNTLTNDWVVFANRDDAPVLEKPRDGAAVLCYTRYLGRYKVFAKEGHFLKVAGMDAGVLHGWVDLRHFILSPSSIVHPKTRVRLKAFFRVKMTGKMGSEGEKGTSRLRFRSGPGLGLEGRSADGKYQYLSSDDQVVNVGSLISYVFGVHFIDDKPKRYQDSDQLKEADYFLVGDYQTFRNKEMKAQKATNKLILRGWIPSQGAVVWDTRQALEKRGGPSPEAHIFGQRNMLYEYYSRQGAGRQQYLRDHEDLVVVDTGASKKASGQNMRPIILKQEQYHKKLGVYSEQIGFSGNSGGYDTAILADIQEGARHLDLCFLVDGTLSMKPVLIAAAEVCEKVVGILRQKGLKPNISAAYYRDEKDGSKYYGRPRPDENVVSWLSNVQEYSSSNDPDYLESVNDGILSTVRRWKFSHPYSFRVLVILGDVGDNGRGGNAAKVIQLLQDKRVLPLAVRFIHPYTKEGELSAEREEQAAMDAFTTQLGGIFQQVYGSLYSAYPGLSPTHLDSTRLTGSLTELIRQQGVSLGAVIEEMQDVRYGITSIKAVICKEAFPDDVLLRKQCNACSDKDALLETLAKSSGKGNPGLIMAYLNSLKRRDPTIWKVVMQKPDIGFQEGFVALKQRDDYHTRPVLLLSQTELKILNQDYTDIIHLSVTCDEEVFHNTLKRAMSMIMGEVMTTNPNRVSRQKFEKWTLRTVDSSRALFGDVGMMLIKARDQQLCNDRKLWDTFYDSVTEGSRFIERLLFPKTPESSSRNQLHSTRLYRDQLNYKYFWVYPEEIFPPMGGKP